MKLYSESKNYKLYQGNMLDMLDVIKPNSVDSIVTDPPYELNFMNKSWDNSGIAFQKDTWEKCFKALKPGGHLLAFGGSRTYHRIACAIEDAGFEIRDCIMYIYGSGFPKSLNIGLAIDKKNGVESLDTGIISPNARPNSDKTNTLYESGTVGKSFTIKKATNEWEGWGTSLKPSYEPIIVARKPAEKSIVDNVMKYGVGGINIDECRVGSEEISTHKAPKGTFAGGDWDRGSDTSSYETHSGRFPANLIHDGSEEATKDMPITGSGNGGEPYNYAGREYNNKDNSMFNGDKPQASSNYNDIGSASRYFKTCEFSELDDEYYDEPKRYFYCAKASKQDRDEGLDNFEEKKIYGEDMQWGYGNNNGDNFGERVANVKRKNTHPTVKPTSLMQYLVRLVTPKGGVILDPFNGSGSTGKAAMIENAENNKEYKYIGIELTEEYLPISKARIEFGEHYNPVVKKELKKQKESTKRNSLI